MDDLISMVEQSHDAVMLQRNIVNAVRRKKELCNALIDIFNFGVLDKYGGKETSRQSHIALVLDAIKMPPKIQNVKRQGIKHNHTDFYTTPMDQSLHDLDLGLIHGFEEYEGRIWRRKGKWTLYPTKEARQEAENHFINTAKNVFDFGDEYSVSHPDLLDTDIDDIDYESLPAKRITSITTKYKRSLKLSQKVAKEYDYTCQNPECLSKSISGKFSNNRSCIEVHHVVPLVCDGHDSIDNMIPLCRNCHNLFHIGVIYMNPSNYPRIKQEYIEWHNTEMYDESVHNLGE